MEGKVFDYNIIWSKDTRNPHHTLYNVESVSAVHKRMLSFIEEMEKIYRSQTILLVSHGDPLNILQAGFMEISLEAFKDLPYIDNAEIRKLIRE